MGWQCKQTTAGGFKPGAYEYVNASGARLTVTDYGARVTGLSVPDRAGKQDDVVVGFERPEEYLADNPYFGAVVGRVANRVAGGGVTIGGRFYPLERNDGAYTLHGGRQGFDRRVWKAEPDGRVLTMKLNSPDGDQGLPGTLRVSVAYALADDNAFSIDYTATTDADTLCNLTNHTYWNLGGRNAETILDHELRIDAEEITVYDDDSARGTFRRVAGTPYDFRSMRRIGDRIADALMRAWGGYDFNYALSGGARAEAYDPQSGRVMTLETDCPAVQFYAGCMLGHFGKGRRIPRYGALCLEAQGYPFAPNEPDFPSVLLRAGETYRRRAVYRFSVR